ncbi:MAG: hypothetical protein ACFB0B_17920 [Thermonemataceae bacterium]
MVLHPKDSLKGYYLKWLPQSQQIDKVLLLLPGFGQTPNTIFEASALPTLAVKHNMLVVAVAGGNTVFANELTRKHLDEVIQHVKETHSSVANKPWVVGGFSAGGTIALRYVAYHEAKVEKSPANFQGVFTVDSPVDLFGVWTYFERELARNLSAVGIAEAKYIKQFMEKQEGTPSKNTARYEELTPFHLAIPQGNEIYLQQVAVRVYHDVDVNWMIQERGRSVQDTNFFYSSEMINRLRKLGNQRAEFIQSARKGYRSNGERHPHDWSIVEEPACIAWIKSLED